MDNSEVGGARYEGMNFGDDAFFTSELEELFSGSGDFNIVQYATGTDNSSGGELLPDCTLSDHDGDDLSQLELPAMNSGDLNTGKMDLDFPDLVELPNFDVLLPKGRQEPSLITCEADHRLTDKQSQQPSSMLPWSSVSEGQHTILQSEPQLQLLSGTEEAQAPSDIPSLSAGLAPTTTLLVTPTSLPLTVLPAVPSINCYEPISIAPQPQSGGSGGVRLADEDSRRLPSRLKETHGVSRSDHSIVEKRYRSKIDDKLKHLKHLVLGDTIKGNKADILEKAIETIESQDQRINQLVREKAMMDAELMRHGVDTEELLAGRRRQRGRVCKMYVGGCKMYAGGFDVPGFDFIRISILILVILACDIDIRLCVLLTRVAAVFQSTCDDEVRVVISNETPAALDQCLTLSPCDLHRILSEWKALVWPLPDIVRVEGHRVTFTG